MALCVGEIVWECVGVIAWEKAKKVCGCDCVGEEGECVGGAAFIGCSCHACELVCGCDCVGSVWM